MQANETKSCLGCATSGIDCEVRNGKCHCCQSVAPATVVSRKFYETQEDFRARAFKAQAVFEAPFIASAPVASVEVEAPAKAARTPKKARCPHYNIIKEFAAIARENGLNMKDADRARGAMGVYLGIRINSRAELSAAQWQRAITGLHTGVLFW